MGTANTHTHSLTVTYTDKPLHQLTDRGTARDRKRRRFEPVTLNSLELV